ncbi:hypothetical protein DAPPUDRAFT_117475 [Daphnia pulex]|uniref:Uncharacterized protein n=1 Tax=Daphnia pulex TaxID=6669 RepID=E9HST0_DAPPU|nr:hypothetical protein DAPPUDRAFT_117475 [Daphnia pulex]|eukprot:EFX65201.1 hypothetical protein DAPPUDRAFT_117475 [Daphnia pulex]
MVWEKVIGQERESPLKTQVDAGSDLKQVSATLGLELVSLLSRIFNAASVLLDEVDGGPNTQLLREKRGIASGYGGYGGSSYGGHGHGAGGYGVGYGGAAAIAQEAANVAKAAQNAQAGAAYQAAHQAQATLAAQAVQAAQQKLGQGLVAPLAEFWGKFDSESRRNLVESLRISQNLSESLESLGISEILNPRTPKF